MTPFGAAACIWVKSSGIPFALGCVMILVIEAVSSVTLRGDGDGGEATQCECEEGGVYYALGVEACMRTCSHAMRSVCV